jgi:hypothetical protein
MAGLLASAASMGADRGFDGKWVIDNKANNTATVPVPDGLQQRIRTKGNDVVIESVFKEPPNAVAPLLYLGILTTSLRLSGDGSDTVNQIGPFMQTSKTTINGATMDTQWTATHGASGKLVNGHWTRTLAPDGKHMTLEIKEDSEGQSNTATINFVRK